MTPGSHRHYRRMTLRFPLSRRPPGGLTTRTIGCRRTLLIELVLQRLNGAVVANSQRVHADAEFACNQAAVFPGDTKPLDQKGLLGGNLTESSAKESLSLFAGIQVLLRGGGGELVFATRQHRMTAAHSKVIDDRGTKHLRKPSTDSFALPDLPAPGDGPQAELLQNIVGVVRVPYARAYAPIVLPVGAREFAVD